MVETIQNFFHVLNDRELAASSWILIVAISCAIYPQTRKPLFQLIKAFFMWKLTFSYMLMLTYIAVVIGVLKIIAIWRIDHIPLTILWCICVAFVMLFAFQKANDQNYFNNFLKDNIKGLIFLEFFVNLYVFNFYVEFLLVPIFAFIGGMKAMAEKKEEYEVVDKLLNYILVIFGTFLIIYSAYTIAVDFKNFATLRNFENFYIPILLSIMFIPFVYFMALYAAYETFFIRLQFFVPEKSVLQYAKFKSLLSMHSNLWKLNQWSVYINRNWRFKSREEVKLALFAFKQDPSLSTASNEEVE